MADVQIRPFVKIAGRRLDLEYWNTK